MKKYLLFTFVAITYVSCLFLFTGCKKQGDLKQESMSYQDSVFYELEYGELGLTQDCVIEDWD